MLVEKVYENIQKKIRAHPCHVNRASEIGHPCLRYLVFRRTRWEEATLPDINLQLVFSEGNIQERAVLRDLEDAGVTIIEQQRDYYYEGPQLSAHLDGKVLLAPEAEANGPCALVVVGPHRLRQNVLGLCHWHVSVCRHCLFCRADLVGVGLLMSVPDKDLDEEDREWCVEHGLDRPCRICRDQYFIEQAEAMQEQRESQP